MRRVENPGTLLLRADANATIGSGHVMRCLALAQAWQDAGGKSVIAMADTTPAIEKTLLREGVEIAKLNADPGSTKDATNTARLAEEHNAAWVVADGYRFDSDYQNAVKSSGVRLLVVDDGGHSESYAADLILNQNAHASTELYSGRSARSRLLLGPRYAMLRRQFAEWREWRREIPAVGRRILVTMGGSDPDNFTRRVIDALHMIEGEHLEVTILAGGSNPHFSELEIAVSKLSRTRLLRDADNVPELMAWADLAVSGAGTTCWEMCLLGLPALAVDLAPNQQPVARCLDELGVVRHIGSSGNCSADRIASELRCLLASAEVRRQMSERGKRLVDGRGASRVCAAMMGTALGLRRASESDRRLLWEWRNDEGVRAASFSQAHIGWEEHSRWFAEKLADEKCLILIGEDAEHRAIGQVRFDKQDGEAEIHVSVAPESRGMGYGSALVDAAVRELCRAAAVNKVNAYIRRENLGSLRAFEKAGFRKLGEKNVRGAHALHYCRKLDEKH